MARFELTGKDPSDMQWNRVKGLADDQKHGEKGYVREGKGIFCYKIKNVYGRTLDENSLIDNINRMVDELNLAHPTQPQIEKLDHVWFFGLGGPSDSDVTTKLDHVYQQYVQHKAAIQVTERQGALASLVGNPDEFLNLDPKFKNDPAFRKDALSVNGLVLAHLSDQEKQDLATVEAAYNNNHDSLKLAKELGVGALIKTRPQAFKHAGSDHQNNPRIVEVAYEADHTTLLDAGEQGVIALIKKKPQAFKDAGPTHQNNPAIAKAAFEADPTVPFSENDMIGIVTQDWTLLEHASDDHKNNPKILQAAYQKDNRALAFATEKGLFELMKIEPMAVAVLPSEKQTRDVVLNACSVEPKLIGVLDSRIAQFNPPELAMFFEQRKELIQHCGKAVALILVKENPQRIEQLKTDLKMNPQFVNDAYAANEKVLQYADPGMASKVVEKNGRALEHVSALNKNTAQMVYAACKNDRSAAQFATRKALLDMTEYYPDGFTYLPDNLQKDPEFVAKAFKSPAMRMSILEKDPTQLKNADKATTMQFLGMNEKNALALEHARDEFKKDREVIAAAFGKNRDSLQFGERDTVADIVVQNPKTLAHIGKLREDRNFMLSLPIKAKAKSVDDVKINELFEIAGNDYKKEPRFCRDIFRALQPASPYVVSIYQSLVPPAKDHKVVAKTAFKKDPAVFNGMAPKLTQDPKHVLSLFETLPGGSDHILSTYKALTPELKEDSAIAKAAYMKRQSQELFNEIGPNLKKNSQFLNSIGR